jgi:hypothetical protein
MLIEFPKINGDLYPDPNTPAYMLPRYWSRVLPELKHPGEQFQDFTERLHEEYRIRILTGTNFLGITGVDIDEAMLTVILLKYPPRL